MPTTRLLFEGPSIEALLAQVRDEYGTDVRIVAADKVRSGGVAGFFAKERFEVAVEVDEPLGGAPGADLGQPLGASALDAPAAAASDRSTVGALPATTTSTMPTQLDLPPGHRPVIENSHELPADFLLGLMDSLDARELSANSRRPAEPAEAAAPDERIAPAVVIDASRQPTSQAPVAWPQIRPNLADESGRTALIDPTQLDNFLADPRPADHASLDEAPAELAPSFRRQAAPASSRAHIPFADLLALGLPGHLIPDPCPGEEMYAALVHSLRKAARRPALPHGPGEVIAVVGFGEQSLAAADLVAASLDAPARLEWVTNQTPGAVDSPVQSTGEGAATASASKRAISATQTRRPVRMTGPAQVRRHAARLAHRAVPTVVAIEEHAPAHAAPHSAGSGEWTATVLEELDVSALVAVVDAGRKPADIAAWLQSLGTVEALAVVGCAGTLDPATVLSYGIPVISVDGRRSSPYLWAHLLTDRLEGGHPE